MTAPPSLRLRGRRPTGSGAADLLVAALVFLILCVAVSPFYRAARSEAARLRCEAYRNILAEAQTRYREQNGAYAKRPEGLVSIVKLPPTCPHGGRYRFRLSDAKDRDAGGRPVATGRLGVFCSEFGHRPIFAGEPAGNVGVSPP